MTATAEVASGHNINLKSPTATRFMTYLALPFEPPQLEGVLAAACELAATFGVVAGFVSAEPSYGLAHRAAIGHSIPKERTGLSEHRLRERRLRDYKSELIDTRLAGIEWGTFLGPGHLRLVDVSAVRDSGAFERVVEVSPSLVFLQLTSNSQGDLSSEIEPKLQRARVAMRSLMLDTSELPESPNC